MTQTSAADPVLRHISLVYKSTCDAGPYQRLLGNKDKQYPQEKHRLVISLPNRLFPIDLSHKSRGDLQK